MRIEIAGQGVSFELGNDFRVEPPWNDPAVQREGGMYARHVSLDVEIHLRGWTHGAPDLEGARNEVAEQSWPPPRLDEEARVDDGLAWAAATWDAPPWVVREWFVTDGRSMANAALVGKSRAAIAEAKVAAHRLVLSARFG